MSALLSPVMVGAEELCLIAPCSFFEDGKLESLFKPNYVPSEDDVLR